MSAPPQEPLPHAPSPPTPHGAAQTVLSFLGQAASREAGEAQAEASAAVPTVLGTAQNMLSRLTSSSIPHGTPHGTPTPQQAVTDLFRERAAEAFGPSEVPQRAAERFSQGPDPASPSFHSGGSGERPITPPEGVTRITRSYPALPDAAHQPRPPRAPHHSGVRRRMTGPYTDSETAWHHHDDKDPHRVKTVGERLEPTIVSADLEFYKATKQATVTGWAQNIALGLQIFIGALTTALGAALTGKKTSVAVSVLGGASTLVASFLARTKSSNEPQTSQFRAQALDHFLREIAAFKLDHGHEVGEMWDDKIHSFRLGLEKILGNHDGTMTVIPDVNIGPNKLAGVGDPNVGGSGGNDYDRKYPMTSKTGAMMV